MPNPHPIRGCKGAQEPPSVPPTPSSKYLFEREAKDATQPFPKRSSSQAGSMAHAQMQGRPLAAIVGTRNAKVSTDSELDMLIS